MRVYIGFLGGVWVSVVFSVFGGLNWEGLLRAEDSGSAI